MQFLSGSSNPDFAQKIAAEFGEKCIQVELGRFANGEQKISLQQEVSGEDVCVMQDFTHEVDRNIIQALLLINAAKHASASRIFLFVPYLGYSLQDQVFLQGEPCSAEVIADLLSIQSIEKLFLLDVHKDTVVERFKIPVTHFVPHTFFAEQIQKTFSKEVASKKLVIVSPDEGGRQRAEVLAKMLGVSSFVIRKNRDRVSGEVSMKRDKSERELKGMTAVIYDDGVLTGSTLKEASKLLKELGATSIVSYATHGICCGDILGNLDASLLDMLYITNSVEQSEKVVDHTKVSLLDLSGWMARELKKEFASF